MTRKEIEERCHKLSASESKCSFTSGDILGFIDTSPLRDGSRGIAFYENSMTIKTGSSSDVIAYDNIRSVDICESFENSFADELIISADENEIRISDYSLDKSELKILIDKLCKKDNIPQNIPAFEKLFSIEKDDNETRIIPTRQAENSESAADRNLLNENNDVIENDLQNAVSENKEDISEITENDKISDVSVNEEISEIAKVDENFFAAIAVENKNVVSENDEKDFDEQEELERISSMSHEQTVSYLANAFEELNSTNNTSSPQVSEKENNVKRSELSEEPAYEDIYIKASRKLRELCEEEKLSMEMIEDELRKNLIPSAEVFAEIIENNSEIPSGLSEKINELKNAANDLDKYFSYGEDIGIRTMFFMLFQMLSYSDRIIEDPNTKEKLNDFFRKFGSAGIILSMLDMRI